MRPASMTRRQSVHHAAGPQHPGGLGEHRFGVRQQVEQPDQDDGVRPAGCERKPGGVAPHHVARHPVGGDGGHATRNGRRRARPGRDGAAGR